MKNKLFDVCEPVVTAHSTSYTEYVMEDYMDDRTKRMSKRLCLKPVVVEDRYKGIDPNDFSLENLLAIGYDLKNMQMSSDRFRVLHDVEKYVNTVENQSKNDEK